MFQKVLIPVDGSEASNNAIQIARRMVEAGSIKAVTVLHVVQPSEIMILDGPNILIDYPQLYEDLNKAAGRIVAKAIENLGINEAISSRLEFGSPADIICQIAEQEHFDLIIIGNRGLNKLQRVFLGSVSSRVTTLAHCPVLVAK